MFSLFWYENIPGHMHMRELSVMSACDSSKFTYPAAFFLLHSANIFLRFFPPTSNFKCEYTKTWRRSSQAAQSYFTDLSLYHHFHTHTASPTVCFSLMATRGLQEHSAPSEANECFMTTSEFASSEEEFQQFDLGFTVHSGLFSFYICI